MWVERIVVPEDPQETLNQISFEGNLNLALEVANRLKDPSIANNLRLRNAWETSNRTVKDIEMILSKIKNPQYIMQQCISNVTPVKSILKGDAIDFVAVQRELIKIGLEILSDPNEILQNSTELTDILLEKEQTLTRYELMLDAFKMNSDNEIVDWE